MEKLNINDESPETRGKLNGLDVLIIGTPESMDKKIHTLIKHYEEEGKKVGILVTIGHTKAEITLLLAERLMCKPEMIAHTSSSEEIDVAALLGKLPHPKTEKIIIKPFDREIAEVLREQPSKPYPEKCGKNFNKPNFPKHNLSKPIKAYKQRRK